MIADRRNRCLTPRALNRVRRPVPPAPQNTKMVVVGGIVGVLLLVLVVVVSQRSPAGKAGGGGHAVAQQARVPDPPSPPVKAPAPVPAETALPAAPKVAAKAAPKETSAPTPTPAEVKPVPEAKPVVTAENVKKEPVEAESTQEPIEAAPVRPRDLFPSAGVSSLSKFVAGPEGQEGKADEIVRVAVESLKITRSNKGKPGYSLVLRKVKILKGRTFGEEANQTLDLGADNGDPMKEFGLDPATATGKTMVFFLKNEGTQGNFSFFALTDEDYASLKGKVTAANR